MVLMVSGLGLTHHGFVGLFCPFIVLLGCSLTLTIILFCVLGTKTNAISESFGGWSPTLFILISFF